MSFGLSSRFWSKVAFRRGCWIWTGAKTGGGYGQAWDDGKLKLAHRLSYERMVKQVPAGLDLDHLCRVRACCNPMHLEPVTRSENNRRGLLPSILRARAEERTHCPHGHEYTAENIKMVGGYRACRTCQIASCRAWRERNPSWRTAKK